MKHETKNELITGAWISVKEQMPPLYKKVLAATTYFPEPLITNLYDVGHGKSKWDFSKYVGLYDCTITHWQPLPDLPSGGGN